MKYQIQVNCGLRKDMQRHAWCMVGRRSHSGSAKRSLTASVPGDERVSRKNRLTHPTGEKHRWQLATIPLQPTAIPPTRGNNPEHAEQSQEQTGRFGHCLGATTTDHSNDERIDIQTIHHLVLVHIRRGVVGS